MASSLPLKGSELIDCARANSNQGIEAASERCGYGRDLAMFEQALRTAGEGIGVDIHGFDDLADNPYEEHEPGIEIAPDTPNQL